MGVRVASKASARCRQKKSEKAVQGKNNSRKMWGQETYNACSSDKDYSPMKAEVPNEDGR